MLNTTHTSYLTSHASPEQRVQRPRKIRVDCTLYCAHSVRASRGDSHCDHDFGPEPVVKETGFAVWRCTQCGREFKYETWNSVG